MATLPQAAAFPSEDEKSLAMLNYILSIFSGFLAPLIIWLVKRESKFVAFHALQTLFWHGLYFVLTMVGMVFFMASIFASAATHSGGPEGASGLFMFLFFAIMWGGGIANLVIGIMFAIKAKRGEWTRLPIVGKWARRVTGLAAE